MKDELQELTKPTSREATDLKQKQTALSRRLTLWREVQKSYMPCVTQLLNSEASNEPPPVESTKLFLPSSLPENLRLTINRLANAESLAHVAQVDVALEEIWCLLRAQSNLASFKKLNLSGEGNKANTCALSLFDRLTKKINYAADRYWIARSALQVLDPKGDWIVQLLDLKKEDLELLGKDKTTQSIPNQNASKSKDKTHHLIPWIWLVVNPNMQKLDENAELDVTAQVQWAKAWARALHWKEEVKLIVEEMCWCIAYLKWKATWWKEQVSLCSDVSPAQASGLRAYALKQADYSWCLAGSCTMKWGPLLDMFSFENDWCMNYVPFSGRTPHPDSAANKLGNVHINTTTTISESGLQSDSTDSESSSIENPSFNDSDDDGDL